MAAQSRTLSELAKVAEGREAEMFAWEDGQIVRLLRPGFDPGSLDNEVWAMGIAYECAIPVPRPGQRVSVDGREGVVLERIEGSDLLTELGRAPWTVVRAARICGGIQARMHGCRVEEGVLPALRAKIERQLASPLVPPHLSELAKARLEALPDGDVLCHYDFHPANIMRSRGGPVVIDWPNAARGAPEADVARTLLLLGAGEPQTYNGVLRLLTKIGRRLFIWLYRGAYMRVRPLDKKAVQQWALPVAIARLAEDIKEERARLLQRIEKLRASS